MRKLIVAEFITLDGVIQSSPENGFKYEGWFFGYVDEETGAVIQRRLAKAVDLLLGRETFDIWEQYWPTHSDFWPNVMTATKYVASETRDASNWQPTIFLNGDLADKVRELKRNNGPDIYVMGSANMLQSLFKADLVDSLELMIFPITLGEGKRLFQHGSIPAAFRVTECQISPNGIINATYERDGEVKTGSARKEDQNRP